MSKLTKVFWHFRTFPFRTQGTKSKSLSVQSYSAAKKSLIKALKLDGRNLFWGTEKFHFEYRGKVIFKTFGKLRTTSFPMKEKLEIDSPSVENLPVIFLRFATGTLTEEISPYTIEKKELDHLEYSKNLYHFDNQTSAKIPVQYFFKTNSPLVVWKHRLRS